MHQIWSKRGGMHQENQKIILNILGAFSVKGGALIVNLMTMPAYIKYFQNQTVIGIWYTIVAVLNWMLVFDLGLGNGLRNQLPRALQSKNKAKIRSLISTTYISMSAFAAILMVLGYLIIPQLNWNRLLNADSNLIDNQVLINCVLIVFLGITIQFVVKIVSSILFALQYSAVVNFIALCSSLIILLGLKLMPSSSLEANLYKMSILNVLAMTVPSAIATAVVFWKMLNGCFPSISFFETRLVKSILGIGIILLWLQLVFMVISATNEYLISVLAGPQYVVDYQAYYKVFNTGAALVSLAITPIWSAVTKAQVEKNYVWIIRIYKSFLLIAVASVFVELFIIPFLQPFMNIWIGRGKIQVNNLYGVIFVVFSVLTILHNVNTSIGNGISYFKVQVIWMTFAAIVDIPLAIIMVRISGSWIGVVIANIIALLPYEFIAPAKTMNILKQFDSETFGEADSLFCEAKKMGR